MSTILTVDDNKQGLYMLRVLLEGHGYKVASAANGAEALQEARRNPPDLVLSDILMPVMDGFTLCREWKRDKHLKKIPFVFYTAIHTDPRDQKLALDLGAERFIAKPSAPGKFIEQVKQVLEEHRRGSLVPSQKAPPKEEVFLQRYNEALVRKLEENVLQLEETNRGLVQEIAERRRAEKALGVSEERYRLLIENANEGVLVLQHGKVVFANRKAGEIAGYSEEDLTSKPFAEFLPPEDRQMVMERHLNRLKGEEVPGVFTFKIIDKEGNTKWAEANAVVFNWEGRPAVLALITDITGRKQAEEEISHLASFPQLTPVLMVEFNLKMEVLFINPAMQSAIQQLAINDPCQFIPLNWRQSFSKPDRIGREVEVQELQLAGRIFEEQIYFTPEFQSFQIYATDITERKQAEEEIQGLLDSVAQERDRLSSLVNSITDEVWFADTENNFTLVNPAALREFGYSSANPINAEELVRSLEVYRPDGSPRPVEEAPPLRALRGEIVQNMEEIIRTPVRGELRYRQVSATPVRDTSGNIIGSVSVVRDITERKKAEEELQESEQKFRAIFDNANDGFISVDPERGRFFNPNRRMIEMLGYESEEEMKDLTVSDIHPEKDLPYILGEFEKHARGEISRSEDLPVKRKDGSIFFASISSYLVTIANKTYLSCIFRDVTEHRQAEAIREAFYRRLVDVQEKERQTLARELHDEIGQPLTILKLYLDRNQPQAAGHADPQLEEARKVLVGLIHQVRNMSGNLRPAMLDDLGLLPTLLWHFERYTRQTKISVNFRHTGLKRPLPPEVANTAYRLVQEALTNVARHAQAGEVMVHIRARRNSLTIEVRDHGIGFDLPKVVGKGIGLTGMYERALALNGTLTIESTPGTGTYLLAELPLSKGSEKEIKTRERSGKNSVKR